MANLQHRIQILLSEDQYKLLKEAAEKRHCSIAELIRRAVQKNYSSTRSCRALLALERLAEI